MDAAAIGDGDKHGDVVDGADVHHLQQLQRPKRQTRPSGTKSHPIHSPARSHRHPVASASIDDAHQLPWLPFLQHLHHR